MDKKTLLAEHPGLFFLEPDDAEGVKRYLKAREWLDDGAEVSVAKAGEGNMNCAVRVFAGEKSLVLKQSRPWVEKYPRIEAPWDRALSEGQFYELVRPVADVAVGMPKLLWLDRDNRILATEDLGEAVDFTFVYGKGEQLDEKDLSAALAWLSALHRLDFPASRRIKLENLEMRQLNHAHIFEIPLQGGVIDLDALTPGLEEAATAVRQDRAYLEKVSEMGDLYLSNGKYLLHGDYFPGSWLRTPEGLRVIDPEFAFFGPAAFDVGVLAAHLILAGGDAETMERVLDGYRAKRGICNTVFARRFAGIEIMRRLIGVAQLPLEADLEEKRRLLELSRKLVMSGG